MQEDAQSAIVHYLPIHLWIAWFAYVESDVDLLGRRQLSTEGNGALAMVIILSLLSGVWERGIRSSILLPSACDAPGIR